MGEQQGPSINTPTCSLDNVDVTCEISQENAVSNPPLVDKVSCSDGLSSNIGDALDEGMHICSDMVLESSYEPMVGNNDFFKGSLDNEPVKTASNGVLGKILVAFLARVSLCTWLCSASLAIHCGILAAGNAFHGHGKENFEDKASVGEGSLVALLGGNSSCAVMIHAMCLQQSIGHMNGLCEEETDNGHVSESKQAYAMHMRGTKSPICYVWDPGGCFHRVVEARSFPSDPGGHVFVAKERLEMPFDPGGMAYV